MKIKEQTSKRITIVPTVYDRLNKIPILGFAILWVISGIWLLSYGYFFLGLLVLIASTVLTLRSIGSIYGKKWTLDKSVEMITVEERPFLLTHRRRIFTFSSLVSVEKQSIPPAGESGSWSYKSCMVTDNGRVQIEASSNENHVERLAADMSTFIGAKMVESFGRKRHLVFDPKQTREQAVAKMKRRYEQSTVGKKK